VTAGDLLAELGRRGVRLWKAGDGLRYSAPSADALTDDLRSAVRDRRAELLALLATVEVGDGDAAIPPAPAGAPIPCSFAQERFLFLDELEGASETYNLSAAFRITGRLDASALEAAIRDLVGRHAVLRARFVRRADGFVAAPSAWTPALELVEPIADDEALTARMLREHARPFDVANGPHLRTVLFRHGEERATLLVTMHHIVSDGGSIRLFAGELQALYAWRIGAAAAPPPEPVRQYGDFAHWERTTHGEAEMAAGLAFWAEELAGAPPLLQLPSDRPRAAVRGRRAGSVPLVLGASARRRLDEAARRERMTHFQLVTSAWALLLHEYSHQSALVVGTPWSNRARAGSEGVIGPLMNVLPLHLRIDRRGTVRQLMEEVQARTLAAVRHGEVPFERIVQAVRPERSPAYTPIFQAMCAVEQTPWNALVLPGLSIEQLALPDDAARYDLALIVRYDADGVVGLLKYDGALFAPATAARMARHFEAALAYVTSAPSTPLRAVSLLTAEERDALAAWNRSERAHPLDRTVVELFEAQVRRAPARVAVELADRTLTYEALNAWANRLAHALRAAGVGCDDLVAITLDRSIEMVVAVVGVLKAGAAYVPIDPDYPAERRAWMLDDARPKAVVVAGAPPPTGSHHLRVDDPGGLARFPASDPDPSAPADAAAYVIYTSGSTGRPKGTVTSHRALANNLLWMNDEWPLAADDALLLKSSFSFDVSVKEILWPLIAGARLVVARPGGHRDPEYLLEAIDRHAITVVHMVPTMLDYFLRHDAPASGRSLRIVMCGGEALTPALRRRFHARFDATLLHLYGPTEAAIAVTGHAVSPAHPDVERIPLGRPMANCRLHVLACDGVGPVPIGVAGELCIAGTPLARGYLGRPDLTAERFVPDPYAAEPGGRLYRTGDLARWGADGRLEYVARIDRQVKVRGFRIEPGEIEAAIRTHPGVEDALVVARDAAGADALVAYVVAPTASVSADAVRQGLRAHLPAFMVPGRLTVVRALPFGPNGKIDLDALPMPAEVAAHRGGRPATELERAVSRIWCELLGVERVERHDNFFDAGGHSMLVLRLQERLRQELGRSLSVTELFLCPTVATLAARLGGSEPAGERRPARVRGSTGAPPIAVVGMACRVPGASDVETFWQNLHAGRVSIRFFDDDELRAAGVPDTLLADPRYVRARGVITGVEDFDRRYFKLGTSEAALLDPQIRLLLECAQLALDDAGCDPERFQAAGGRIGAVVASSRSTYFLNHLQRRPEVLRRAGGLQLAASTDKSYAATQLAYRLDLRGPAFHVDTACSSSLVAIHHACLALAAGDADLVLAGGASVDVPMIAGYLHEDGGIASRDGVCRPFDARASGTVKGNGGAVVALKRLDDARRDGDHVHAVIRGSAINNDGASKIGFTAPSIDGQARVVEEALARAGVEPQTVGYVETHGTGTLLGDPVELAALRSAYCAGQIALGALKANIGHLDAGAGVAGFVKAVLALDRGVIPPHPTFETPNPELSLETSAFYVNTEPVRWEPGPHPRRAAVSSFGLGGTNAHVVLEEAPAVTPPAASAERCRLLGLSADDATGLAELSARLAARLAEQPAIALDDVACSLALGRRQRPHRIAVPCRSTDELRQVLDALAAGTRRGRSAGAAAGRTTLVLPGDGFTTHGMAARLHAEHPGFRRVLDGGLAAMPPELAGPVRDRLLGRGPADAALPLDVEQTAAVTVQAALVEALREAGLRVHQLLGHGLGEYVAAYAAGVFSLEGLVTAVVSRARLSAACPPGGMVAVGCDEATLRARVAGEYEVAVHDGPTALVLATAADSLDALEHRCREARLPHRRLAVPAALHSGYLRAAGDALACRLAAMPLAEPHTPFVSSRTGDWIAPAEARSPQYWGRQLTSPVLFARGLETVLADPGTILVDVTPRGALAALAARVPGQAEHVVAVSERGEAPDERDLVRTVGQAWMAGAAIAWDACLPPPAARRRVSLPGTVFQRSRHWIDAPDDGRHAGARADPAEEQPWRVETPAWEQLAARRFEHATGTWLVIGGSAAARDALATRITADGATAVTLGVDDGPASRGDDAHAGELRAAFAAARRDRPVVMIVDACDATPELLDGIRARVRQAFELGAERGLHPRVTVVTRGGFDVLGDEPTDGQAAACVDLWQELASWPGATAALLDLSAEEASPAGLLAGDPDALVQVAAGAEPGAVAAFRRGRLWRRRWKTIAVAPGRAEPSERGCLVVGDARAAAQLLRWVEAAGVAHARVRWLPGDNGAGAGLDRAVGDARDAGMDVELCAVAAPEDLWCVPDDLPPGDAIVASTSPSEHGGDAAGVAARHAERLDALIRAGRDRRGVVLHWKPGDEARQDRAAATARVRVSTLVARAPGWSVIETDADVEAAVPGLLTTLEQGVFPELRVVRRTLECAMLTPAPGTGPAPAAGDPVVPTPDVAAIWCDVLGVGRVGDDDDFFALGGHSLLATHVLRIVEEGFGVSVDLDDFYAEPTVAGLRRLIAGNPSGGGREQFEV